MALQSPFEVLMGPDMARFCCRLNVLWMLVNYSCIPMHGFEPSRQQLSFGCSEMDTAVVVYQIRVIWRVDSELHSGSIKFRCRDINFAVQGS
jgi:hypothetical protein